MPDSATKLKEPPDTSGPEPSGQSLPPANGDLAATERPLSPTLDSQDRQRGLTVRSVLLGSLAILAICAVAPYNDFTLGNTPLIGNYLPISVVMLMFLFVVGVNGPLSRYWPRHRFGQDEIAVLMGMVLVGCAVPTTGLMRYFLPSLVTPQYLAGSNPEFATLFRSLHLPGWIFPTFASTERSQWPTDPIVMSYIGRAGPAEPYPYLAFVVPLLTWGIFFALLAGALISLVRIAYAQWAINERLAFPLAQIQLALIEPPEPGRWLNTTLANRSFWLGLSATFLLHIWNGLSIYTAGRVPTIPLTFDLSSIFREPPFSYAEGSLYRGQIFITAVAVTYFLRLPISFSLWVFFLAQQVVRMLLGSTTGDPEIPAQQDLCNGAFLGFTLMTLYVGRRYFWATLKATLFRSSDPTQPDAALQATTGRVLLLSVVGMVVWLVLAGCSVAGAIVLVLTLLLLFFGLTRVVAETGLLHANMFMSVSRPFALGAQLSFARVPNETYYMVRYLHCIFYDQRESLPVYAANSMRVANPASGGLRRNVMWQLTIAMAIALALAYFGSAYFHLRNEYTYAATLGSPSEFPIDSWGAKNNWNWQLLPSVNDYAQRNMPRAENAPLAIGSGVVAAVGLYAARLLIPAWPLHPIGLVMLSSYSLSAFWMSFFLAWLIKGAVVRFGGYGLYNRTKPLAIGLIIGESLAAATWLVVAVILAQLDLPFHTVQVLPR